MGNKRVLLLAFSGKRYLLQKVKDKWYVGVEGAEPCMRLRKAVRGDYMMVEMTSPVASAMTSHNRSGLASGITTKDYGLIHIPRKHPYGPLTTRYVARMSERRRGRCRNYADEFRMLQAVVLYMRQRYGLDVHFSDTSCYRCEEVGARGLLCYGRTWYMEKGAVPCSKLFGGWYAGVAKTLAGVVDMPWEKLRMCFEGASEECATTQDNANLRKLYEGCYKKETWNTFFKRLHAMDKSVFYWHSQVLRGIMVLLRVPEPSATHWHFPREVVERWGEVDVRAVEGDGERVVWLPDAFKQRLSI